MKRKHSDAQEASAEPVASSAAAQHDLVARVAVATRVPARQVQTVARLLDDGASLPFVARYRKEATGGLDEAQLRAVEKELARAVALEAHRASVLSKLERGGALGGAGGTKLRAAVAAAESVQRLEDLYLPHKPKRATRASAAKDRGLAPLADALLCAGGLQQARPPPVAQLARPLVRAPEVPTADVALAGARDILAERAAELPEARQRARADLQQWGVLVCKLARGAAAAAAAGAGNQPGKSAASAKAGSAKAGAKAGGKAGAKGGGKAADADVFATYHGFRAPARSLRPHQVLAINRGEALGVLSVSWEWQTEPVAALCRRALPPPGASLPADYAGQVSTAVQDGIKRLLRPAAEREVRALLTEAAVQRAGDTFGRNLRALLLQPPLPGLAVLGVDPAYRTGKREQRCGVQRGERCKLAVCGPTGDLLETATIHPHPPAGPDQRGAASRQLQALVAKHGVRAVAIGNGVASRETQRFVAACLTGDGGGGTAQQGQKQVEREGGGQVGWCVVSEAGASVYSASELAAKELPGVDVSLRGAASIARRLMDPLAELVKVDPASLGVGQYQHDVKSATLVGELAAVVESVVNEVGVDLNSASPALLAHVAGLNKATAAAIVAHREAAGPFSSRRQLLGVKGVGAKTFENAAGFLRIRGAANVLDSSGVHPESYSAAARLVRDLLGGSSAAGGAGGGKKQAVAAAAAVPLPGEAGEDEALRPRKKQKRDSSDSSSKKKNTAQRGLQAGDSSAALTAAEAAAARPALAALLAPGSAAQLAAAAARLGLGQPTLRDVAEALLAPGRDVRGAAGLEALQFKQSLSLAELKLGMEVNGIVRNVVDFGCFCDINCAEADGLVHISEWRRWAQASQKEQSGSGGNVAGSGGGAAAGPGNQQQASQLSAHDFAAVGRLSLRPRAAARPAARLALRVRATAAVEKPSPAGKPAKKDEPDHVKMVLDELAAKDKVVIASTAPAVRVSIGEEMGLPAGTACTGKMVAALKELGFDYVFGGCSAARWWAVWWVLGPLPDTLVAADLVIMEERLELLERLHDVLEGRPDAPPLPMFTSCCPGWVNFVETMAPEIIPHVSSTKSPQMVVRGLEGVKEASVTIAPHPDGPLHNKEAITVNVAVANGLGNAKKVLSAIKEGQKNYHFVEVRRNEQPEASGAPAETFTDKDLQIDPELAEQAKQCDFCGSIST
eukprot:scaffold9.g3138.t1